MAEEVLPSRDAASRAAEWIIFPAKFFQVPANYKNNVTREISTAITAAAYLLTYPNSRMQYDQFFDAKS
jgi:hypothetical protein